MKKILLSILFLLTIFESAFSEQINQSNSNFEPIEVDSGQNRKDQVLFDKTESKILLKDKNVSDLDKDSQVELSLKNKNSEDSNQNPALEKHQFENSTKQNQESKSGTDNEDSDSKNDTENKIDSDSVIKPLGESRQSLPEDQKLSESINEMQEVVKIEQHSDAHSEIESSNKKDKLSDKNFRSEQESAGEDSKIENVQVFGTVKTEIIESLEQNSDEQNLETKAKLEVNQIENVTENFEISKNGGETNTLDKNLPVIETEDRTQLIENLLDSNTDVLKKSTETSVQNNEENFNSEHENIHSDNDDTSKNEKIIDSPSVQTNEEKTDVDNAKSDILQSNQQELDRQSIGEIVENHSEKTFSNEPSEFLSQNDEKKIEETNAESNILQSNQQNLDKSNIKDSKISEDQKNNDLDEITVNLLQNTENTKLEDAFDNFNSKEQKNSDLNMEAELIPKNEEKTNELVTNLVEKDESENNLDLKDESDSETTETMFTENVSESPVNFESTTSLSQNFDDKIEESKTHLDSLSKKFSNKIKKLKEHSFKSVQEEIDANTESSNSTTNDRVCANLHNFKQILSENVEPLYLPIVSLLPEDIQLVLLNESFAGIPNASLIFLILNIFLVTSFVFLLIRIIEGKKINLNASLNNQLILQTNRIRQLEFDLKTYASLIEESEQKKSVSEALIGEKDYKIKELNEKLSKSVREQEFTEKELSKLKTNETKLIKESNLLRTELNNLNEVFTQQKSDYSEQIVDRDTKIIEFTQVIESQKFEIVSLLEKLDDYTATKDQNTKLNSELSECLNAVEILKNSLSIKNSSRNSDIDDYVQVDSQDESNNADSLMNLAQLQMDYKNLQSKYDDLIRESQAKEAQVESLKNEIESRKNESGEWDTKLKKFEKQIKENEMQIRLLNELRERDTKQHVKALSELDLQLKKKTADAEKVGHYMEQLRVKQERIQELETNLTRVEKQSNIERQTFEKQAHENWLNAKKLDKELRETRTELDSLRERMKEIGSGVTQENLVEEPPRPPSTSSNSGGMFPPNGPGFMPFMRQPAFRYPFPPINPAQAAAFMQHLEQQRLGSTSPNQDSNRVPNGPPPHILHRFLQAQQFMPHQMVNSVNSSQQVSPTDLNDSNILASTALNDSSMNNIDNAADNTQNMMNEFDFSSNSGYFNQNGTENFNGFHPDQYSNENVNSNFNV